MITMTRRLHQPDPLLLPDRDEPYALQAVYEKIVDGSCEEIVIDFGDVYLRFSANANDDTISGHFHNRAFAAKRGYHDISAQTPWPQHLSKECGWTWLAINQQGYWDAVLISFETVVPNVLLYVMASSIYVMPIGPLDATENGKTAKPRNSKKSKR